MIAALRDDIDIDTLDATESTEDFDRDKALKQVIASFPKELVRVKIEALDELKHMKNRQAELAAAPADK